MHRSGVPVGHGPVAPERLDFDDSKSQRVSQRLLSGADAEKPVRSSAEMATPLCGLSVVDVLEMLLDDGPVIVLGVGPQSGASVRLCPTGSGG